MGDIYKNDYDSFFILLDGRDHDVVEELQQYLNNKDQKWLLAVAPYWSYRVQNKSHFLYFERRTVYYFYHDISGYDIPYRIIPSLLASQVTILLKGQELQTE